MFIKDPRAMLPILIIALIFAIPLTTFNWKQNKVADREVEAEYTLQKSGINVDIYEFTPEGNPDYTCVVIDNSGDLLSCFPKGEL